MGNLLDRQTANEFVDELIMAVLDENGRYTFVSKEWQKFMGLSSEDTLGRYVTDAVPGSNAPEVLRTGKTVIGKPIVKNGKHAFTTYLPRLDKNGAVIGVFLYVILDGINNAREVLGELNRLTTELEFYKNELSRERGARYDLKNIIGKSEAIAHLKDQIMLAARSTSTVLIEGETGSGKELIAHAIHAMSPRRAANFVRVNCSAIPPELMESEFFGYTAGAFTGAARKGKIGRFELANNGSIFLDEINLLSSTMQPKFLRVLQEREIDPVGGEKSIPIDTRVIAASNVPLERLVESGSFRSDLFYRLNVIRISAPPLRSRKEDIPLLVDNFIQRFNRQLGMMITGIDPEAVDWMMEYDWPGNVRELQNAVESAMNVANTSRLMVGDFEQLIKRVQVKRGHGLWQNSEYDLRERKEQFERELIHETLKLTGGNRVKAAQLLGISRTVLYEKINKYKLK